MFNSKSVPVLGLLLSTLVWSVTRPAQGGEVSGGTDYHPDVPAWFTSQDYSRTISVCYEVSPGFAGEAKAGLDAPALEGMILEAFQKWDDYYHVKKGLKPVGGLSSDDPSKPYRDIIFKPALPLKNGCTGSEDLSFYFGVETDDVRAAKMKLNTPYGLAALKAGKTEAEKGWTPGFIWLADTGTQLDHEKPMWSNYQNLPLRLVILHELGHVFGCAHHSGTIMDGSDFPESIAEATKFSDSGQPNGEISEEVRQLYYAIDGNADLVTWFFVHVDETYSVREPICKSDIDLSKADLFKRFVGKEAKGSISGIVTRKLDQNDFSEGSGILELKDESGAYQFSFFALQRLAEVEDPAREFQTLTDHFSSSTKIYTGELILLDGNRLPVGINYNANGSRFSLIDLSEHKKRANGLTRNLLRAY